MKIKAPCVFQNKQYTATAIPNDTGIDSSVVKCGPSAEVPWAPDQLWPTVLVRRFGSALS